MRCKYKANFFVLHTPHKIKIGSAFVGGWGAFRSGLLKFVQLALMHLTTTSGPRGTLFLLSTKHRCISIIKLLQFAIGRSLL